MSVRGERRGVGGIDKEGEGGKETEIDRERKRKDETVVSWRVLLCEGTLWGGGEALVMPRAP